MRGILIIFTLVFSTNLAVGQDSWFKTIPGWSAINSIQNNDTLFAFGLGVKNNFTDYILIHSINNQDIIITTDTLDYSTISKKPSANYLFFDNLIDIKSRSMGITYHQEVTPSNFLRNCDVFSFPSLTPLGYHLNIDTFETELGQYQEINGKYYGFINWKIPYREGGERVTDFGNKMLRFNTSDITITILKEDFNEYTDGQKTPFHQIRYARIYGDKIFQSNLFLKSTEQWGSHTYKVNIDKLDSTGKTLWTCRPDASDSFNTTNLQMVQKPNGNLLCSWTNYYYSSGMRPGGHPYIQEYNKNCTPHFAEVDYETGEVLWVKTQKQYFNWKMIKSGISPIVDKWDVGYQDVKWVDAKIINNKEVLWVGSKLRLYGSNKDSKIIPVIYKTDLDGNPIWYREHEIYPSVNTRDEFIPNSFTILPQDSGILLTGEYRDSSGQHAALLKLDKNGCREQDCERYDGIRELESDYISIYPNPSKGIIYLEGIKDEQVLTIVNSMGQTVWQGTAVINKSIDVQFLAKGVYFLIATGDKKQVWVKKVVME